MLPRAVTHTLLLAPIALFSAAACSDTSTANPVDSGTAAETGAEGGTPEGGEGGTTDGGEAGACVLSGLTLVGPQSPKLSAACTTCLSTTCCKQGVACAATKDCAALASCVGACPSPVGSCAAACETAHPTGVTAGRPFLDCELSACDVACQSFACVGSVKWPAPTSPTVTFKYRPTDFASGKPLVGATVKVCAATDTPCATPSAMYTTDSTGVATVTAPSSPGGIAGYLEVSQAGSMTTLDFLELPAGNATLDVMGAIIGGVVLSTSTWTTLTKAVGITPDPTRGYLTFIAEDCALSAATGVKVTVSTSDAKTKSVYIAGGIPSSTAPSTDASGEGAVINLPAGPGTVTGTDAAGKKFSSEPVVFRAGAVTLAGVIVTP
jgi:hypothetical protein